MRFLVLVVLWGCVYRGSAHDASIEKLRTQGGWLLVADVPVIREDASEATGAAALSMVLSYWHTPTATWDVMQHVPVGEDSALLAANLSDYAERHGVTSFVLRGERSVLENELRMGRPVIVGVVKAFGLTSAEARYEVVVGYHPEHQWVLTLDPKHGVRQNTWDGFASEWERSERLTVVLMPRERW